MTFQTLSTRSKEVSMQNSRLQELENILSQTTIQPKASNVAVKGSVAPEELTKMKEENRVVS